MKRPVILFVACLLLFSCASKPPKKVESPSNLYVEGVNLMKAKKWEKAIEKFSQIRENFPFDPMSFIATVKLADTYFEKKEYGTASGIYEEFVNAHPDDENIPYVLTRLGECYEKLSLTFDRDQAYTIKAMERFTYLKNRFPNSNYAKVVDIKLKALTQKLADRELYVGEFYYRTYQYNAAIIRLEYFLKKYPDAKGVDRAFYHLALCHKALGNLEKSDYYMELLRKEFPKSIVGKTATRERKTLRLAAAATPLLPTEGAKKANILLTAEDQKTSREEEKKEDFSFFDQKKPVDIVSDTMEGFDKEKYVIFKGSVVAKQEDLYMFADVVEAYMNEKTNEIEKAYARGNVRIVKKERTATSKEALLDNAKGQITLKGNVVVFSGPDKLTGEVVTYYVNEDRVVVEGQKEQKAHITVNPKQ